MGRRGGRGEGEGGDLIRGTGGRGGDGMASEMEIGEVFLGSCAAQKESFDLTKD